MYKNQLENKTKALFMDIDHKNTQTTYKLNRTTTQMVYGATKFSS